MLTLVRLSRSDRSAADVARLMADYLAFDRNRATRRQYARVFGGMAVIVLAGAAMGTVPANEALVAAGLPGTVPWGSRLRNVSAGCGC